MTADRRDPTADPDDRVTPMRGLMMDVPLTVPQLLQRAATYFPHKPIVSRLPDGRRRTTTYGGVAERVRRLAGALLALGLRRGDRVGTLCWNHQEHLESYFAVPLAGGVLHTINARLHHDDLAWIINDARDRFLIVDEDLLDVFDKVRAHVDVDRVVVVTREQHDARDHLPYEDLLRHGDERRLDAPELDERDAATMCYTSGTTGRPKGVVYSHRALVLHSLMSGLPGTLDIRESDVVMLTAPMFHVNGWGFPYTSALFGASQVLVGRRATPTQLVELVTAERVSIAGAVPTVCSELLRVLDDAPRSYDLSSLRSIIVASSAVSRSLIQTFDERHGVNIVQAWGMTETAPTGCVSRLTTDLLDEPPDVQLAYRAKQGMPAPLVDVRVRGEDGLQPWDAESYGELEVRGPWVASSYHNLPESSDRFTDDGWLRTGDVATIDPRGFVEIRDRLKDLVKSGGEWISSVALENALMAHPAVAEAAVIAVHHDKWQERPLAVVALREDREVTADELRHHLEGQFASWWLPDDFEFVDEIPKTTVGKFDKAALRDQHGRRTETQS